MDRTDKKMDRLLSGVGDGCDSCLAHRSLWTDLDSIEQGFECDRTLAGSKETWASLRKKPDGEVMKVTGDFETRQGLCHQPKALRDSLSFTVTHKWMKCADHKMKIIHHLMIEHHSWVEDASVKAAIAGAKKAAQEVLKPGQAPGGSKEDNQGVAYGFPDARGLGGNTTTAELCRKMFLSGNLRKRMVNLCPQLYRPAMEQILFNEMILLRYGFDLLLASLDV